MTFPKDKEDYQAGMPASDFLQSKSKEQSLLDLCLASVQTVDPSRLRAAAATASPLRPQMLLTLLTYAYTSGHYDSRDIIAATSTDPTLRYICAGTRPLWTDLRRFRRHNREVVAQCLSWVLTRVATLKPAESEECFRAGELSEVSGEVSMRLQAAALMDGVDSE